jgi:hypothetical protein
MTVDSYTSQVTTIVVFMKNHKKTLFNEWLNEANKFVKEYEGNRCNAVNVEIKLNLKKNL